MPKRSCRCGNIIEGKGYECSRCRSERRRMAPELGLTGERATTHKDRLLRAEILEMARRRGEGCTYCGAEPDTVDHFRPLALGGERYDKANIVPCCSPCNTAKGASPAVQFMGSEWLQRRRAEVRSHAVLPS